LKSDNELIRLCNERNYQNLLTRQERIQKLNKESLVTGNAAQRIAGGIIGISPS